MNSLRLSADPEERKIGPRDWSPDLIDALRRPLPSPVSAPPSSIDKGRFQAAAPLDRHAENRLRHANRRPSRLGLAPDDRRFWIDPEDRRVVELKQPTAAALALLGTAITTVAEISLDPPFATPSKADDAFEALHLRIWRPGFDPEYGVRFYWEPNGTTRETHPYEVTERYSWEERGDRVMTPEFCPLSTRYDAERGAPFARVMYRRAHAKLDPSVRHVVRVEDRLFGHESCAAHGVGTAADLLFLDHRRYWQRHLLAFETDPDRLGRYLRNRAAETNRRRPELMDFQTGRAVLNSVFTMQELIGRLSVSNTRLTTILRPVEMSDWLPPDPEE